MIDACCAAKKTRHARADGHRPYEEYIQRIIGNSVRGTIEQLRGDVALVECNAEWHCLRNKKVWVAPKALLFRPALRN